MNIFLLLLFFAPVSAIVRVTDTHIEAECERFYEPKQKGYVCSSNFDEVWNRNSDSQGVFDGMNTLLSQSRSAADTKCEQVCARTNACRAYAVSSSTHFLTGNYECRIYYSCPEPLVNNTNFDTFVRKLPFNCFIKGTSFDGVFSNFDEVGGELAQFQRLLRIETRPFQEVHFTINGNTDTTAYAYRPYKKLAGEFYCGMEEDALNCILMNAGVISIIFFFIFVILLGWNTFLVLGVINK